MNNFTPGPWICYQRKENSRWEISNKLKDRFIADLRGPDWPGIKQGLENDANARLIASAPDLYEACKFSLESGDDLEAIRKLKAAINKAEGKTGGENK